KLTVPGMPDLYQGSELWDLSLMDPDNRRPVDYGARVKLLEKFESNPQPCLRELLCRWETGAIKLFVISRILKLRAAKPDLFQRGDYEPLQASGPQSDLICAFLRRRDADRIIVVTSRFPVRRSEGWGSTVISGGTNGTSAISGG